MKSKYNLVGIDGNAFSIIGYVRRAMQQQKFTNSEINDYVKDAMSSDYTHLLGVSVDMVEKCNNRAANH